MEQINQVIYKMALSPLLFFKYPIFTLKMELPIMVIDFLVRYIKTEKGNLNKRMKIYFKPHIYYLYKYSGYKCMKLWLLLLPKQIQKLLYSIYYAKK